MWTDGIRAYMLTEGRDALSYERDGTDISGVCAGVFPYYKCQGVVHFNLTDECWTPNPAAVASLVTYGQELSA